VKAELSCLCIMVAFNHLAKMNPVYTATSIGAPL
jgi:hypothetical protein